MDATTFGDETGGGTDAVPVEYEVVGKGVEVAGHVVAECGVELEDSGFACLGDGVVLTHGGESVRA